MNPYIRVRVAAAFENDVLVPFQSASCTTVVASPER